MIQTAAFSRQPGLWWSGTLMGKVWVKYLVQICAEKCTLPKLYPMGPERPEGLDNTRFYGDFR